jgi:hypothetical protein
MSTEDQQFADEKFMCATEKKKVLRAWIRFLESGCKKNQFTEALYHHLIQRCSFIAHYDRHGYYGVYFERLTPDIFRFFDQFDPQKPGFSAEYGATYWLSVGATGADLNAAMRDAAGPYLEGLRRHFEEVQRQAEIAAATRLLAKHGLTAMQASSSIALESSPVVLPSRKIATADPVEPQLFTD